MDDQSPDRDKQSLGVSDDSLKAGADLLLENREALRSIRSMDYVLQENIASKPSHGAKRREIFDGSRLRVELYGTAVMGDFNLTDAELISTFDEVELKTLERSAQTLMVDTRNVPQQPTIYDKLFALPGGDRGLKLLRSEQFLVQDSKDVVHSEMVSLHGYICRKITRSFKGEVQIEQWLATEMSGFPIRYEMKLPGKKPIKSIEVIDLERVELDGRSYAFPIQTVTKSGKFEQIVLVDRKSLKINQPVDPSLFRQDDVHVRFILDVETGHRTDTTTGKVYDSEFREMRASEPPKTSPIKPSTPSITPPIQQPSGSRRSLAMALILIHVAVLLVLYSIYRRRR